MCSGQQELMQKRVRAVTDAHDYDGQVINQFSQNEYGNVSSIKLNAKFALKRPTGFLANIFLCIVYLVVTMLLKVAQGKPGHLKVELMSLSTDHDRLTRINQLRIVDSAIIVEYRGIILSRESRICDSRDKK